MVPELVPLDEPLDDDFDDLEDFEDEDFLEDFPDDELPDFFFLRRTHLRLGGSVGGTYSPTLQNFLGCS